MSRSAGVDKVKDYLVLLERRFTKFVRYIEQKYSVFLELSEQAKTQFAGFCMVGAAKAVISASSLIWVSTLRQTY